MTATQFIKDINCDIGRLNAAAVKSYCFLLALAPLLAAARTYDPKYCDLKLIRGLETEEYIDFNIITPDGLVNIDDKCSRAGRELVGEDVAVCNYPFSKPIISTLVGADNQFKTVSIDCPSGIPGCSHLNVNVRQYCKMVTPPVTVRALQ
ncbi:uncharacterized protein LOC134663345 [Cydia fagiglandana]|uniref:uncharacterized protein LOC134663345 n=1 Tax=Cydia fagiglandana TaxID=1458189 RepID=UPI002FEDF9E7